MKLPTFLNPVAFLSAYWKPVICLVALLAAYGAGYYRESESCAAAATALRAQQEQAIIDQQLKVITGERRATAITTGVSNDYEKAISDIVDRYGKLNGLRPKNPDSTGHNTGIPNASAGDNGSTGNCGFAQGVRRHKIEEKLDEQAQRLIACQAWITEQRQSFGH